MATYYENTSQQPGRGEDVCITIVENRVLSRRLVADCGRFEDKRGQPFSSEVKEKHENLSSKSRPNDPLPGNSLNTNEGSESAIKTEYDQSAFADRNRHTSSKSEQPKESTRSDASASSNARCQKCPNCGVSNEPYETPDAINERSQNLRNSSSNDSQTQTSASTAVDPPTDRLNRQLSVPESQSEDKKLFASKQDPLSSHSLSIDPKAHETRNSDSTAQTPTNSKHPSESDNQTGTKLRKSIVSSTISFPSSSIDSSTTDETVLPELPPSSSSTSPTPEVVKRKYQGSDDKSQPQVTSDSSNGLDEQRLTSLTSNERSKEQDESPQSSPTVNSIMTESKENDKEKNISLSRTLQRVLSYTPSSSIDDQQVSPASFLHYRSEETRDFPHIVYVPNLPANGLTNQELESMIRHSLEVKNRLRLIDIKCNSQFNFGIIYLQNKEDKDRLVNIINRISIGSNSDRSVLFVSELEFISYIVVKINDRNDPPRTSDVQQQWTQVYQNHHLSKCKRLCPEFPNIFRIVINPVEQLMKFSPVTEFSIRGQMATVYFRVDCCFFEALSRDITATDLHSAIRDQLFPKNLSKANIYIQVNEIEGKAVVLTCNEARRWKSFNSITYNGQVLIKKDRLTYSLRLRSVPSNIPISSIEKHQIFSDTVLQTIPNGKDAIVELLSKDVYETCLRRGILRIDDHIIDIEENSLSSQKKDDEIDASNWYETEMVAGRSNIMDFVSQPTHRIFRLKWNPQTFLEQFHRCSSQDKSSASSGHDHRGSISDQQRHLLRMTVMLNTIGIVKRGCYSLNGKKIEFKSNPLNTIVYNHQSTLQHQMTIPLARGIDYLYKSTSVRVINEDCLIVYEQMISHGNRPLLLNMANATSPGGGYRRGDGAQEENLFRRSDYYRSLDIELDQGKPTARFYCSSNGDSVRLISSQPIYPMNEFGAIYTSGLTIFRQPEDTGYELMEKPMFDVCAIAIAAYQKPTVNDQNILSPKYSIGTRKKIETIFAIAKHHNHDCLILSAFGCGAFQNPPKHVAMIFKSVIEQYAGFFKSIYFAIIDDHNTGQHLNPRGNYQPFCEILDGLGVQPIIHTTVDMMVGPWRILNEISNKEITLSDVQICSLPPCHYGAKCQDIADKRHCREYIHPPLCPFADSSKTCDDDNHMLWFRHRTKDPNDLGSRSEGYGGCDYLKRYHSTDENDDVNRKSLTNDTPLCPWTPFHCRQHTLLAEATDVQALPDDDRNHCRDFRHICRFGRQCEQTSTLHWESTIHIARDICLEGKKCSKINQENHLNSFSHPGIADIRRLCHFAGYECRDREQFEHLVRYRHYGNYDCSTVIRYRGLNHQINFVQHQQDMIAAIHNYAERLKLKTSLSIQRPVLKCIRGLSPIYQCSKAIFELILAHGHVMSRERLAQLRKPEVLIQTIEDSKHIQSIIVQHKHQAVEGHINKYIKAIVSAEYSRRTSRVQLKATEYTSSYSPTTISDENFNDTIRREEKFLRGTLGHIKFDTIRQWTIKITEASLNLPSDSISAAAASEKYITTVLGPHLRQREGDIVLVFKREVMFHPDANFSIQSNERPKQFPQTPLHCSIDGYEYAAAAALITTVAMTKKSMDIDLKTILRYMSSAQLDEFFEGHLPEMIPLDYIEEVHTPQTLFSSLSSSAQLSAKDLFCNSLHITSYEGNRYQDHVNENLIQKLSEYIERSQQQLHGSTITLPPSHLTEYVTLPFTLVQVYDQYCRNYKRDSLSNDIYIYWQSMYGDMTMVLSKEPVDSARSSEYTQCLVCYISETPSTTTSVYQQSYSYLNVGHPSQHTSIVATRSFLASSNTFHRGCNVDDYLTYCLKLDKSAGQVTLSHAGPNSIYNNEMISHRCTKSNLDLNTLKYIQISAGSQRVPIRNLMVCFLSLPDLHPSFDKNFHRTSIASKQPNDSSAVSPCSSAASKDDKSPDILSRVINTVSGLFDHDYDQKRLTPCRDSINCLRQTSEDHCRKYSHPCRFSELCRVKYKESYLTHEPHRVEQCALDKSCHLLGDSYHRATFRHTGRPDFLIPCRDQVACQNRSSEHRVKYSHGEKIHLKSATAVEKPQTPSKTSILSSEYDSKEQQKTSTYSTHNDRTPCRHGSKCRDQNLPHHCSQYSHPSEQRPRSSADHDHLRAPHRFGSAGYQTNDAFSYSTSIQSDPSWHQSQRFDYDQRRPCPFGIGCRYFDTHHRSKYSHSS